MYVFNRLLKQSTVLVSRMCKDREFQRAGAAETNERSPNVARVFTGDG